MCMFKFNPELEKHIQQFFLLLSSFFWLICSLSFLHWGTSLDLFAKIDTQKKEFSASPCGTNPIKEIS